MPRPNQDKTNARDRAAAKDDAAVDRAGGKGDNTADRLNDPALDKMGDLRDDVDNG